MPFPQSGQAPQQVLKSLAAFKEGDLPWAEGRVFAYVYDAGPVAMSLLKDAYSLFLTENGLDPTSFPSCLELEKEVIGWAIDLQEGGDAARGSFTSGGTESILLSVKTARDFARATRPGIKNPELLLPETAHAAFFKACHYFDVTPVRVAVDPATFQAVPEAMEAAITRNTIMVVGSAPSYAHGVIDPIGALAAIAQKHGLLFHVDACVGGMYLPFAKRLGHDIPDFNLSVPGVTQLSMDFHKWGYAAKGASAILYKNGDLRRHQIFAWSGWTGYTIINPTVLSSKSGGPVAACWAILQHLGMEGYLRLVQQTQEASERIRNAITAMEGVRLLGDPKTNIFSFAAEDFNIFALADVMKAKGWFIQPQFAFSNSPANLHLSVGASNAPHVEAFLKDLETSVAGLRASNSGRQTIELPPEFLALLENPEPGMFEQLAGAFGTDGSELPGKMQEINDLMNAAPPAARDRILIEFVNRLYAG